MAAIYRSHVPFDINIPLPADNRERQVIEILKVIQEKTNLIHEVPWN
jgi:hypothetical protein